MIGVFFAFAFAFGLGIVPVSTQSSYTGALASFLFGQILGISGRDVLAIAVFGAIAVAFVLVLRKKLVTVSLDPETATTARLGHELGHTAA